MTPAKGDTIVVWFSSGAASAVAAKLTIEKYHECIVRVVNNPIADEDTDNLRFLHDVEKWLGVEIESATNSKYPNCSAEEVWEDRKYMSGVAGAPCTGELKKKARQQWESNNKTEWMVLGFTADEKSRHENFVLSERNNVIPVLIAAGLSKDQCFEILIAEGLRLPITYYQGWPNANCPGCVKATSPTYWNFVRKMRPDVWERRVEQSRRIGARLVRYKNKRIFLDELPADAKGRSMKSMSIECGIFCEERGGK